MTVDRRPQLPRPTPLPGLRGLPRVINEMRRCAHEFIDAPGEGTWFAYRGSVDAVLAVLQSALAGVTFAPSLAQLQDGTDMLASGSTAMHEVTSNDDVEAAMLQLTDATDVLSVGLDRYSAANETWVRQHESSQPPKAQGTGRRHAR